MHLCARRCFVASLAVLLSGTVIVPPAMAAPIKINGAVQFSSFQPTYEVSPDGTRVLYYVDQPSNGTLNIYMASISGGTPVKINGATGGVTYLHDNLFTADGSHVVYTADEAAPFQHELFSVPVSGGPPVRLNVSINPMGGSYPSFLVSSSNGSRIMYSADPDVTGRDIFLVDADGSNTVELNLPSPFFSTGDFSDSRFTPDGSHVLVIGELETAEVAEMFVVPVEGGTPLKLSGPLAPGASIDSASDVQFTPDGSKVVFRAEPDVQGVRELFVMPLTGGTPLKLNGTLTPGGSVGSDPVISGDGTRVLYVADQETDGTTELYSAPITGGTAIKLSGPQFPGGDVDDDGLQFSPDGSKVLYVGSVLGTSVQELFVVPSAGGSPIKLNGTLVTGGDVVATERAIKFTKDGSRVLYLADQEHDNTTELYSVLVSGGPAVKLNNPLPNGGDVQSSLQMSPDGARVAFSVRFDTDNHKNLYIMPVDGGTPVELSSPLAAGTSASDLQFLPDGDRVIFMVADVSGNGDLYTRVVREHLAGPSGQWQNAATWDHATAPDNAMHIVLDTAGTVTASGAAGPHTANLIDLGGGTALSTLKLEASGVLTSVNRLAIRNKGVLRGDGDVIADVTVAAGGEVRVASQQRLHVSGNSFANSGRVEAIGTSTDSAEIEFDAVVTNAASTGLIAGSHARLRFNGGLTNAGALALTGGENHVFGDIQNTGQIVVTGGSAVTFYDDIVQNGTLTISKVGSTASAAVFLGNVSGSGTMNGGGDVFLEGDLRPGNSPGTITFNNNIFLGSGTQVEIEIGGTSAGVNFDTVQVNGDLALNGHLNAKLINSFLPEGGSEFEIVSASELSGGFSTQSLPAPQGGIDWGIVADADSVTLRASGVRGDYNYDGSVDAGDYILWRSRVGSNDLAADGSGDGVISSADYDVWQSHFGLSAVSGTALAHTAAVPEPSAAVLLAISALLLASRRKSTG